MNWKRVEKKRLWKASWLAMKVDHIAQEAIQYGAERVYLVDDPAFEHYLNRPYTEALTHLVKKYQPEVFLDRRHYPRP